MNLNAKDGGQRRFILVEGEDYANDLTRERVVRVQTGFPAAEQEPFRSGLGGTFTYCTLGDPVEMHSVLAGRLPTLDVMAGLLWHNATATPHFARDLIDAPEISEGVSRLGSFAGRTYWLFYRPDLAWLKSGAAALSLTKARAIAAMADGEHLVFAPAVFVSRELLARENIKVGYAPLPFALYKLEAA